jgi:K+-sensing histidine kinase KdpD
MIGKSGVNYRSLAAAILIPLIAAGLQWLLWPYIQPFIWFLFYPAVFISSWIGGRWGGVVAALLSIGLAVYIFALPMFGFKRTIRARCWRACLWSWASYSATSLPCYSGPISADLLER